MILKIKSVKAENFMSFESFEVNFDSRGFTLISGINNYKVDNAKSNGVGKSSIEEAIVWCFTGKTLRGTTDVKNYSSKDTCSVEVQFEADNDEYVLTRTKDKTNLILFVNGQNVSGKGIRDTEKILSNYLPDLTLSLIGSVIILGQGLPQRLTNNTPSGRKEVLENLTKSDFMIADLKNRVSARSTALSTLLRGYEDTRLKAQTQLQMFEQYREKKVEELNNFTGVEHIKEQIKLNEHNITEWLLILANLNDELDGVSTTLTKDKIKYNEYTYKLQAEQGNIKTKYNNSISEIKDKIVIFDRQRFACSERIKEIENIVDVCPTCGQKLPNVFKKDPAEYKETLAKLDAEIKPLREQIKQLESDMKNELDSLKIKYDDEMRQVSAEVSDLQIKEGKLQQEINKVSTDIADANSSVVELTNYVDTYNAKLDETKRAIDEYENNIKEQENVIAIQTDAINYTNERLDLIKKMNTALTRDFRGFLLTNVINYVNIRCKYYSSKIFNTDLIDFTLDGNDVSITYNNKAYENLSGGEKQKVDIIVQFSIRDMLCNYMNFSCNILMLDEIMDNLDSYGCQQVINLIVNELNDIESVFIISHHTDLDIPYDHELVIEKNEHGISSIL